MNAKTRHNTTVQYRFQHHALYTDIESEGRVKKHLWPDPATLDSGHHPATLTHGSSPVEMNGITHLSDGCRVGPHHWQVCFNNKEYCLSLPVIKYIT